MNVTIENLVEVVIFFGGAIIGFLGVGLLVATVMLITACLSKLGCWLNKKQTEIKFEF